jgi:DHA1 family bicyclomycin/chloramphenicol resistance-like MFS transporter
MNYFKNMFIGAIFVLTQLSGSLYIPCLPLLSRNFAVSHSSILMSLSVFFFGYAIGHLTWGTLSDRLGRKKTIVMSLVPYCAITLGLAFTKQYAWFISLTCVLGFVAAAYTSVGNALLKDLFGAKTKQAIGYVGIAMAVSFAFAPTIGSHLLHVFGWQSIYLFLFCFALINLIGISCLLKETERVKTNNAAPSVLHTFMRMLKTPAFVGAVVPLGLLFGTFFAYMGAAVFIYVNYLHYSVEAFGYIMLASISTYVIGTLYNSYKIKTTPPEKLLRLGISIAFVGSILVLAMALSHTHILAIMIAAFSVYLLGVGMVLPSAKATAMQVFSTHAGQASSLMKFMQTVFCFVVTAITAHLHNAAGITPFAITLFIVATVAFGFFMLCQKRAVK